MPLTDTRQFMEALFKEKPDDQWILLWKLDGHKSTWFNDIYFAADFVQSTPDDIYVGVGVSAKGFGPSKRCPQNSISGIPGFYVDIDVREKIAHKGKNYPKTMNEAFSLVNNHGFDPTMIINSGYGLHCYWLFEKLWMFENDPERFRAKMISKRMNQTIKNRAIKIGYDIDSIFDLSRILRPAGSFNCKKKKKEKVTIITDTGPRYDPDFFDDMLDKNPTPASFEVTPDPIQEQTEILTTKKSKPTLVQATPAPTPPKKNKSAQPKIKIDLNAKPNFEKIAEMQALFEGFIETWGYKRPDLPSPSEYDMSLANFGAKIKMTDQEIADMIIFFRKKHNLNPTKCNRIKYMTETIIKAKKKIGDEILTAITYLNITKNTPHESPHHRQESLDLVSQKLAPFKAEELKKEIFGPGLTERKYTLTVSIVRNNQKSTYKIHGDWNFIARRTIFIDTVQGAENINIRVRIKTKEWDDFSQNLSNCVIEERVGQAQVAEKMKGWIEEYINKYNNQKPNTLLDSLSSRQPFKESGCWWFFLDHFKAFVSVQNYEIKEMELLSFMNEEHIQQKRKRITPPGKAQVNKYVWRIPRNKYHI